MTIGEIIRSYAGQNRKIELFISHLPQTNKEADEIMPEFSAFMEQHAGNTQLGLFYAMYLQLVDGENVIRQFDHEDIRDLYQSLVSLDALPADMYEEAANFEWAVMDDAERAKSFIGAGIHEAQQRIAALEALAADIEKNKNH